LKFDTIKVEKTLSRLIYGYIDKLKKQD